MQVVLVSGFLKIKEAIALFKFDYLQYVDYFYSNFSSFFLAKSELIYSYITVISRKTKTTIAIETTARKVKFFN